MLSRGGADEATSAGEDSPALFAAQLIIPFKLAGGHVEGQAETAGHTLVEPNVADGHGQFDVAHALAPDATQSYFDTAAVADDALVLDALILAAGALPVTGWPEDALTEETTFFGFERPVVDGFRVLYFTPAPALDGGGRSHGNGHVVKALGTGIAAEQFA